MDITGFIRSFAIKLTFIYIALGAAMGGAFYFFFPHYYFAFFPVLFLYFYAVNLVTYWLLIRSHNLSTIKFTNLFTKISTLKFLGSLIFAVVYLVFSDTTRIPFLVIFIILYFLSLYQLVHEFLKFMKKKK